MSLWQEWRVVLTDQSEQFILRTEEQGAPVVGLSGETLDNTKVPRVVKTLDEEHIKIQEMTTETGSYYQLMPFKVTCPAQQTVNVSKTLKTDINLVSAITVCRQEIGGDLVEWSINPHTTVGVLGVSSNISDTIFTVNSTVIQNAEPRFCIRLAEIGNEANNYEDLGIITDINEVNSTVTSENAATQAWPAGTTAVQVSLLYVMESELPPVDFVLKLGDDKIGATYLQKGTVINCKYTNNHATDTHNMYVYLRYMYGRPYHN